MILICILTLAISVTSQSCMNQYSDIIQSFDEVKSNYIMLMLQIKHNNISFSYTNQNCYNLYQKNTCIKYVNFLREKLILLNDTLHILHERIRIIKNQWIYYV